MYAFARRKRDRVVRVTTIGRSGSGAPGGDPGGAPAAT